MLNIHNFYDDLIQFKNLHSAWRDFRSGKSGREDVCAFEHNLEDNLFELRCHLAQGVYRHGGYKRFVVCDPKQRIIHRAAVRDRVVHALVARKLEEIYQPKFIAHSFSCQRERGVHKALFALTTGIRRQSKNFSALGWYLKCDIRKFFDNIDHAVLLEIIKRKISDGRFVGLLAEIINSFYCLTMGVGLPLGNFTSQWFANIYMNEFDHFIKERMKVKFYVRYADDFVMLAESPEKLQAILGAAGLFLLERLKLTIHPDKTFLNKISAGIDWVGYKIYPHYAVLRKSTRNRMLNKVDVGFADLQAERISGWRYYETVNSYLGLLKHCNGYNLGRRILLK